jgi:hypothetical protein
MSSQSVNDAATARPLVVENHDVPCRIRPSEITTPWLLHGPNGGFRTHSGHVSVPILKPDDVVVVLAHKVMGIREAITAQHAQLIWLPKYGPDMKPIEMAFPKL